jgi:hypothetical protein
LGRDRVVRASFVGEPGRPILGDLVDGQEQQGAHGPAPVNIAVLAPSRDPRRLVKPLQLEAENLTRQLTDVQVAAVDPETDRRRDEAFDQRLQRPALA